MPRTLEDFAVGDRFTSDGVSVTAADIVAFAASFDPQPFHTDPDGGARSLFGGHVASGWHTAGLTMRMMVGCGIDIAGGMIGRRVESLEWPRPTYPGDVLSVELEVLDVSASPKSPLRGRIRGRSITRNQKGEVVQDMVCVLVVPTKEGWAALQEQA